MARWITTPKWIAVTTGATVALLAPLLAFHVLEQFLIGDPRFEFKGPESGANTLEVSGAGHVSPQVIEDVFAEDFGRSVYLVPLGDRRASLRTVDWVKDASVARFWPNRVTVGVTERKPVAFVAVASGRPMLIDEEGVLLQPGQDRFMLPLLRGASALDPQTVRRVRVQLFQRVMKDLAAASSAISEVDVSDPDNVKVKEPFSGRTVTLMLGDRNFAARHQNFINYYSEIHKRMSNAAVLDLRLEDRITVVQ